MGGAILRRGRRTEPGRAAMFSFAAGFLASVFTTLKAFAPVGQRSVAFHGTNFMGTNFAYLPLAKRKALYGFNGEDAELGNDDDVLGNVPFLMAYGNKVTNKENAPCHGTF